METSYTILSFEIQIHNAWQWSLPPFRNLVRNVHHAGLPGSKVHGASLLPVPSLDRQFFTSSGLLIVSIYINIHSSFIQLLLFFSF